MPEAITFRKDIVGAAETGSGKTLAYGLPVRTALVPNDSAAESSRMSRENTSESRFFVTGTEVTMKCADEGLVRAHQVNNLASTRCRATSAESELALRPVW